MSFVSSQSWLARKKRPESVFLHLVIVKALYRMCSQKISHLQFLRVTDNYTHFPFPVPLVLPLPPSLSRARCFNGACFQWNERMNLHRAYVHFGSFLLSHGHPDLLSSHIAKYKERFHSGRVSVPWLRGVTEKLVEAYRSGQHLNRTHGRLPPSGKAPLQR